MLDAINELKGEVQALKVGKVTDNRRGKLEKLLKDTGVFGKATLKSFDKMKDMSDEEFDEYYESVEEDLASLNQERANAGLENLGAPEVDGVEKEKGGKKTKETEAFTDEELDDVAEFM